MAGDEQDVKAEREPEERAEDAPLKDRAELPVEGSAPEVDAARPEETEGRGPAEDSASEMPAEPADASQAALDMPAALETPMMAVETESRGEPPGEAPTQTQVEPGAEQPSDDEPTQAQAEPIAEQPSAEEPTPPQVEAVAEQTPAEEVAAVGAEAAPSAPGAVVPPADAAWYVIHCYSGYENKVRHNLEQRIETMGMKDRIFDVVIPTQEEIEVREGKRRTVERHIFPGYVLVNMTLSEESWYVVRNTPGVTGFVGMGNLPTPLRPEEVAQIVKRMEAEAPTVKVSFKAGERVRIIDGPFNDFRGTVADIDMEHTKVRVMVSFFGRETPVELDFLQVEKA